MCEGILQTIDPDSSFLDYLRPLTSKLVYQAYAGPHLLGRLGDSAAEAAELLIELPRRADRVLGEIERGNLRICSRIEDIEISLHATLVKTRTPRSRLFVDRINSAAG